jgi:hypothetical protein
MSTLEEASEIDLMTAWLKKVKVRDDLQLTRLGRTEVRHVCLYKSQQLSGLRTMVLEDGCNSGHVVLELREVIAGLESLIGYLEGTKGAFSAMGDRNTA